MTEIGTKIIGDHGPVPQPVPSLTLTLNWVVFVILLYVIGLLFPIPGLVILIHPPPMLCWNLNLFTGIEVIAVSKIFSPTQAGFGITESVTVGKGFTVTVTVSVTTHPELENVQV